MSELSSLFQILAGSANLVIAPMLPFVIWMLADLRRDVREIKNVNISELHRGLGGLRDRITAIEQRHQIEDNKLHNKETR